MCYILLLFIGSVTVLYLDFILVYVCVWWHFGGEKEVQVVFSSCEDTLLEELGNCDSTKKILNQSSDTVHLVKR